MGLPHPPGRELTPDHTCRSSRAACVWPGSPAPPIIYRHIQMADTNNVDYYEILQVSQSADPETIHRVYRFLAQRFHPDNAETGNEARFREIHQAYTVISDAEQRARYDISYQQHRKERWRLVA